MLYDCIQCILFVCQIGGLYLRLWRQKRRILAEKGIMPSGGLLFPTVEESQRSERSESAHDQAGNAEAYEEVMHQFKEDVMNEMHGMMEKYISDSGSRYNRAAKVPRQNTQTYLGS